MPRKSLDTTFTASGNLTEYMGATGRASDALRAKMAELKLSAAKGGGDDGGGGLAGVRQQLGGRSQLGQLGSILTGGAAVGGVTLISKALGDAAEKAEDLVHKFQRGKIEGGAVAAGLAESIPVLGTMVTAFDKVGNLLASFPALADSWAGKMLGLDDRAYAEKIMQEEQARKVLLDYQTDALERQKKVMGELAQAARHSAREAAGANLDGYDKERFERQAQNEDKIADLKAKRQQALDESIKDRNTKNAEIGKQDIGTNLKVEMQTRLAKTAKAEQARINREFDEQEKGQAAATAAEEQADKRRHLEGMAKEYTEYAKDTADTLGRADVERLKASGDTLGAELAQVKQNAADKKAAIDEKLKEQMKGAGDQTERTVLQADADGAKVAVDKAAAMERQNVVYKEMRDAQVQVLQAQAAGGDENAAAELKRLQAGREYTDEATKLLAVIHGQGSALGDVAQAQKNLDALTAAQTARVAKDVRDQHQAALQQRSEDGGTLAERKAAAAELAADQIKQDFAVKGARAKAVQEDKNATAEQKRQADDDLKSLAETSGREYDKKVNGHREKLKQSFSAEENLGGLSGVAASARARRDPAEDVLVASKEGNRLTADLLKTAAGILDHLSKGTPAPAARPIFGR